MAYKINYKSSVARDVNNIGKQQASRILDDIEKTLSKNPGAGTQLKGQFKGLYKHRVGEYRVIYTVMGDMILVLRISHRSKAYQNRLK